MMKKNNSDCKVADILDKCLVVFLVVSLISDIYDIYLNISFGDSSLLYAITGITSSLPSIMAILVIYYAGKCLSTLTRTLVQHNHNLMDRTVKDDAKNENDSSIGEK